MKIKITSLDKLFSSYIKARDKYCQRCGGSSGLQTSHFHGRAKRSVRWDTDNARLLCFGCHQYFHSQPAEHTEWFKQYLGEEAYDLLKARANTPQKVDIEAVTLYIKAELGELI